MAGIRNRGAPAFPPVPRHCAQRPFPTSGRSFSLAPSRKGCCSRDFRDQAAYGRKRCQCLRLAARLFRCRSAVPITSPRASSMGWASSLGSAQRCRTQGGTNSSTLAVPSRLTWNGVRVKPEAGIFGFHSCSTRRVSVRVDDNVGIERRFKGFPSNEDAGARFVRDIVRRVARAFGSLPDQPDETYARSCSI